MRNWPDILRVAATLTSSTLPPSQLLRKFAAYPRQHERAVRSPRNRTCRTHALHRGLAARRRYAVPGQRWPKQGRGPSRAQERAPHKAPGRNPRPLQRGPAYRMAGLNLLAAIVIYWNTVQLDEAVRQRKHAGLTVEPELLAHISPLGWAHILLTGEYRWPKRRWRPYVRFCPLPESTRMCFFLFMLVGHFLSAPVVRFGAALDRSSAEAARGR